MSVIVNVCGLLVATATVPDATIQSFYQQYYHCNIETGTIQVSSQIQPPLAVNEIFPQPATWWPVFSSDQLQSASFKRIKQQGIRPGVILPNDYFSVIEYLSVKKAVNEGAIPIIIYQMKHSKFFAAKSTFSTAIGLRPLAALIETGWDENMISQPAGSYIIQSDRSLQLPVPARQIQHHQHYFYQAVNDSSQSSGYQIIINPAINVPLNNIEYPQLGISWQLNHINYRSTPEQIHTSLVGKFLIAATVIVIPLDYIFSTRYPSLLSTFEIGRAHV